MKLKIQILIKFVAFFRNVRISFGMKFLSNKW